MFACILFIVVLAAAIAAGYFFTLTFLLILTIPLVLVVSRMSSDSEASFMWGIASLIALPVMWMTALVVHVADIWSLVELLFAPVIR